MRNLSIAGKITVFKTLSILNIVHFALYIYIYILKQTITTIRN